MKYSDSITSKDLYKTIFQRVLLAMTGPGRQQVSQKFDGNLEYLRQNWEGYHLLEFAKSIRPIKQNAEGRIRLDDLLKSNGIEGFEELQKLPSSKESAFTKEKSLGAFEGLAEFQDIPLLECFLNFLEFCRDSHPPRPLKVFVDSPIPIGNEKKVVTIDYAINEIKKHLKNEEEGINKEKTGNELIQKSIEQSSSDQPRLTIPVPKAGNTNYFANVAHPVIGRTKQKERLEIFLKYDPEESKIAWFQLAGLAGQGKSRLAFDLLFNLTEGDLKKELGWWRAGFLTENDINSFKDCWDSWEPNTHHLLIFDYVVGREEKIKSIFQKLIHRDQQKKFSYKIRILLLERQPWNQGIILNRQDQNAPHELRFSEHISDKAEWFIKLCNEYDFECNELVPYRFEDGVEELSKLDQDDLVIIVKELLTQLYSKTLSLPDKALKETLERIDISGRPLYAHLLAQQLSVTEEGYQSWTKIDLLNLQLTRDKKRRWEKVFEEQEKRIPTWGENHPAMKLAVLATMVREVSFQDAHIKHYFGEIEWSLRKEALSISSGYLINTDDHPQRIFAMEPDLLGEWFVLLCFYRGLEFEELLDIAWQYSPVNTAIFLYRITQDFIDISKENNKENLIEKLIAYKPPHGNVYESLAIVAVGIADKLHERELSIPQSIFDALEHAANSQDDIAMSYLGYFYNKGVGVEKNLTKSFEWYSKAVCQNKNNSGALINLGQCYYTGEGTDQDLYIAIELFHQAAKLCNSTAMVNLGVLYEKGIGVEQNWGNAVSFYQLAIKLGDSSAMINLASCYLNGTGVEKNTDTAIDLLQQAVDLGHSTAMFNLGLHYQNGEGVEQDWDKAIDLYRQAVALNNDVAMVNLGLCYERGEGIEQDLIKAIELYQRAVEQDNIQAMINLAFCYQKGPNVEQNLDKIIALYQRAVELNNSSGMINLAYFYVNGIGVEKNLNKAVDLYQRAIKAGEKNLIPHLQNILQLQNFLAPNNYRDQRINGWTNNEFNSSISIPEFDPPLLSGAWKECNVKEVGDYFSKTIAPFQILELIKNLEGYFEQYARFLPLKFYKNCNLVDIQLYNPSTKNTRIYTAIINTETGKAILLNGTQDFIYLLNKYILSLNDEESLVNYLQFFCSYAQDNGVPFQIIFNLDEISLYTNESQHNRNNLNESFFIPECIEGNFEKDGWQKFKVCALWGSSLYTAHINVFSNGIVSLEDYTCTVNNLPVLQRKYDGVFRTPLGFNN